MTIPLKYLQLHNPLFLAGTNLGNKLDISKRPIKLIYDREHQEVLVYFNDQVSIIPVPAVSDMIPVDGSIFKLDSIDVPDVAPKQKEEVLKSMEMAKKRIKAQASSPVDHVFAEAPGKIRD